MGSLTVIEVLLNVLENVNDVYVPVKAARKVVHADLTEALAVLFAVNVCEKVTAGLFAVAGATGCK